MASCWPRARRTLARQHPDDPSTASRPAPSSSATIHPVTEVRFVAGGSPHQLDRSRATVDHRPASTRAAAWSPSRSSSRPPTTDQRPRLHPAYVTVAARRAQANASRSRIATIPDGRGDRDTHRTRRPCRRLRPPRCVDEVVAVHGAPHPDRSGSTSTRRAADPDRRFDAPSARSTSMPDGKGDHPTYFENSNRDRSVRPIVTGTPAAGLRDRRRSPSTHRGHRRGRRRTAWRTADDDTNPSRSPVRSTPSDERRLDPPEGVVPLRHDVDVIVTSDRSRPRGPSRSVPPSRSDSDLPYAVPVDRVRHHGSADRRPTSTGWRARRSSPTSTSPSSTRHDRGPCHDRPPRGLDDRLGKSGDGPGGDSPPGSSPGVVPGRRPALRAPAG